ncbi:MAG: M18 family aminopeptidase [Ruminococcaceae bacterium]|nr:M18 family aminopeptidase [Oscillospiraceae bacterium]
MEKLCQFLDYAHSAYHAVDYLKKELVFAGYQPLSEGADWKLTPGGKYYLTRGGSAILAFRVPVATPCGFMMSAAHSDRPTFKLKENGELEGKYTRLSVERYGGMLIAPWLDRTLSLAGRVLVETERGIESKLLDIDRDLLLIPNVAIHMNRAANDGYKWNPAVDVLPLIGGKDAKGKLTTLLEKTAGGKLLGQDLFLYVRENAKIWGIDREYISAQGIDDLACAWACTEGFLGAGESGSVPVLCIFDSEEVGSGSVQGAASDFLEATLQRICASMGWNLKKLLSQSFMVSADNGHALHPNHPELADPPNAPLIGGGVVLKFNAAQKYTTDGVSGAMIRAIAKKADVPVQTYYNRADLPGGSTLGYISLSHVSVLSADIGLAQLSMHSCYETAGVSDAENLVKLMTAYYGSSLSVPADGIYQV